MKRNLYTLITGEVHQSVLASSFTQAITWAEKNLPTLGSAELLTVTVNAGIVDLTSGPQACLSGRQAAPEEVNPVIPPPVRVKAPKPAYRTGRPAKAAKAQPARYEDELTNQEAAELLGGDLRTVSNLKYRKVLVSAGYGKVTRGSVEAYLSAEPSPRGAKPGRKPKATAPAQPAATTPAPAPAAPAPAPYDPAAPWQPLVRPADKYVEVAKACRAAGLNDSQLHEVKRHGRIAGGNGWVNLTQLEAYMQHPDYEPPFASN